MAYSTDRDLIQTAKESFIEGDYATAEPLLQQSLLKNNKDPEVYQMLATLYYDKGQFNKAIKTFKKALEVDPAYTDASVGLSIILNDLGRYDEAKQIFGDAQKKLDENKKKDDPFINEKIAQKHGELGDLYYQIERFEEALEQYYKCRKMLSNPSKIISKLADCLVKINKPTRATQELQTFLRDYPQNTEARTKLGLILYHSDRTYEAVEEWERVLAREPNNTEAQHYLQLAQETELTEIIQHREI